MLPDDIKLFLAVIADVILLEVLHRHETVSLRGAIHDVDDAPRADVMTNVGNVESWVRNDDVLVTMSSNFLFISRWGKISYCVCSCKVFQVNVMFLSKARAYPRVQLYSDPIFKPFL